MNKQMILLALAAGSITAVAQHGVSQVLLAHHQGQHETPYDLMANQPQPDPIQPLEQLPPGEANATGSHPVDVPPSILPADAEVGPGTIAEPGSARPQIRTKQGWSWKNLLPQPAARPSASLVLTRTKEQLKVTKDPIWQQVAPIVKPLIAMSLVTNRLCLVACTALTVTALIVVRLAILNSVKVTGFQSHHCFPQDVVPLDSIRTPAGENSTVNQAPQVASA